MSQSQDLAFRVQLLEEQVEDLTRRLAELSLARAPTSLGSYQVVSRPLSPRSEASSGGGRSVSTSGEYNALAAEIPDIPADLVRSCTSLSGGTLGFRQRAARAWEAGHWAKFTLQGRISKPRPTKPVDLSNTCYIILKADGYVCPLLVHRASDYRFILGDFKGPSISHGWPSLAEAKVYCQAAEVPFPSSAFSWQPRQ